MFDVEIKDDPRILNCFWLEMTPANHELILNKIRNMPPSTIHVNLSGNRLGRYNISLVMELLKAIPSQPLKLFSFGFNELGQFSADELGLIFEKFPLCDELDLTHNKLNSFSEDDLIRAIQNIPSDIQHINLSRNNLEKHLGPDFTSRVLTTTGRNIMTQISEFKLNKLQLISSMPSIR